MTEKGNVEKVDRNTYSEIYSNWAEVLTIDDIPDTLKKIFHRTVLDCVGLMVAARNTEYVNAAISSRDGSGSCTTIGHQGGFSLSDAALISGIAVHGEDFDDTFEGTPVHVGAVLVPAVMAAAEANGKTGADVLQGLVVGGELVCRLAIVAPTGIHRAGFHPTAVIGTMGAAAGVAKVLGLSAEQMVSSLGIAGSLASGIIEYLSEGTSTKRLHPGWAAQSGIRAARLAQANFSGPRTVFEGTHGLFNGFSVQSIDRDFDCITRNLGKVWHVEDLAIKPYACGTMVQPFIDCAISLRKHNLAVSDISKIIAFVGEGTVHRLWEPRKEKISPSTPYSAKFSVPFGIALGLLYGKAGLDEYTEHKIQDDKLLTLTQKVFYQIDPDNEYPQNYTGHIKILLNSGRELEASQSFLRGGRREPLSDDEVLKKFVANTQFGGWDDEIAIRFQQFVAALFEMENLDDLKRFRF